MEQLWQVLLRAVSPDATLSCEDCFMLMDHVSELLSEGYPPNEVLSLAAKWLGYCPDCQDEYRESLQDLFLGVRERSS